MNKLGSQSNGALKGKIRVPGDKSISHRALLIGASAVGETRIKGLLEADDVLHTTKALRALGVSIDRSGKDWCVNGVGVGGLTSPADVLFLGNSGTGARLLMGLLSTQDIKAYVTGDSSLRSRPMYRVIEPLSRMGAFFDSKDDGRMPITLHGSSQPIPISYSVPIPSAQVKSAILLAGLNAPGLTTVLENEPTRNHTENLLRLFGAKIVVEVLPGEQTRIELEGYPELLAADITVPGDPSSAAYPGVAALITPGSNVTIENVCFNPIRTGLFETLNDMGADIEIHNLHDAGGERIADLTFRHTYLKGVEVPSARAPSMIDEYPVAAIAAAFATGETRFCGLAELRVKESNRFSAIIDGLIACGVSVHAEKDDIIIEGCGGPPPGGAEISVNLDHRVAMSYLVMGVASQLPVFLDDGTSIGTSFPGFIDLMNSLGANIGLSGD